MYRVGKRKKRRLERPRRKLEDNIRIGFGEGDERACNGLIWGRWRAVVNTVTNLRVPPIAECLGALGNCQFFQGGLLHGVSYMFFILLTTLTQSSNLTTRNSEFVHTCG